MHDFTARLKTLEELQNPTPCTAEQEKAFPRYLSYLDSLAERKTSGRHAGAGEAEAAKPIPEGAMIIENAIKIKLKSV